MMDPEIFRRRRDALCTRLETGIVVLRGHPPLPGNIPMNLTPARQSSHVLFLSGFTEPDSAILLRVESGRLEIFVPPHDPDDEIWHGPGPSPEMLIQRHGAAAIHSLDRLEERIAHHQASGGGPILTLPSADPFWSRRMKALGVEVPELGKLSRHAPSPLADALVELRLCQDEAALQEMRQAALITREAFRSAMARTGPGGSEAQLRALIDGTFVRAQARPAYSSIVTVRGEILHCRDNPHRLESGQLLLVDAGCEVKSGYGSDVTRTWPVNGRFSERQRVTYELVLRTQLASIARVKAGVEYQDIHLNACRMLAEGLVELGLLRGDVDELVAQDAHALFFPHGLGHLLGLDVHDIEDLGDRAGYAPGRERSSRFGLAWLRLNRRLEAGMVVTIEPGLYFIPGILENPAFMTKYDRWVNFAEARKWIGFGGIRIEDDVRVTQDTPEILSAGIGKQVAEVEDLVGSRLELAGD